MSLDTYARVYKQVVDRRRADAIDNFAWAFFNRNSGPATSDELMEWKNSRRYTDTLHAATLEARDVAQRAVIYDGVPSWSVLKRLIYLRDRGLCWCCGIRIRFDEGYWLGHLHDRARGGLDTPDNLVVQCAICNLYCMPPFESAAAARAWREDRGPCWRSLRAATSGYRRVRLAEVQAVALPGDLPVPQPKSSDGR